MKRMADFIREISNDNDFYELSDEERKGLQQCLTGILQDIICVCDKHQLCLMCSGGSALGAVRHQGFIPWDDDVDLMMPRADYNKLLQIAEHELGEKYHILSPYAEERFSYIFMQIMKKNTLMKTLTDGLNDSPGIGVDIFPVDIAPDSKLKRIFHGRLIGFFYILVMSVKKYRERNANMKKLMDRNIKTMLIYRVILMVGFFLSWIPSRKWYIWFDKLASSGKGKRYMTIPTGRAGYFGELLPKEVFLPLSKGIFEGLTVNLPHNPDAYLGNLYGDYMTIPPPEKRERHFYTAFSLENTRL